MGKMIVIFLTSYDTSFSLCSNSLTHAMKAERERMTERKGAKSFDARHFGLFCVTGLWQSKEGTLVCQA